MPAGISVIIRRAEIADAAAIADTYNEAILTTTATFDTETKSVAEQERWLQAHDERHPVLVAVVDRRVVGWASLTQRSDRHAYDDTAETSFYVHSTYRGRGVGWMLNGASDDAFAASTPSPLAAQAGSNAAPPAVFYPNQTA